MISFRLAVPAALVAAAAAGCFIYFANPLPPVEAEQRLPPTAASTEEQAAAFRRAAAAILRQLPNAQASVGTNERPITEPIPFPKRRPIPRP
jgi:hypothetical protein